MGLEGTFPRRIDFKFLEKTAPAQETDPIRRSNGKELPHWQKIGYRHIGGIGGSMPRQIPRNILGGSRTHNLRLRRPALYPIELRRRNNHRRYTRILTALDNSVCSTHRNATTGQNPRHLLPIALPWKPNDGRGPFAIRRPPKSLSIHPLRPWPIGPLR